MKKLTPSNINEFINSLSGAKTEEDVKNIYARFFEISYDTSDRHDLYTPEILFEFKYDKNLKNIKSCSHVLAQLFYYVRKLKYGEDSEKSIPPSLCLCDANEAVITETSAWIKFYDDIECKYDWDLAPSTPDEKLVLDIEDDPQVRGLHIYKTSDPNEFPVFAEKLEKLLQKQLELSFKDKKIISEQNFEEVFKYWNKMFGDSVRNGTKTSRYFVSDIEEGSTIFLKDQGKAYFHIGTDELKEKKIVTTDYEHFWGLYEKVRNPATVRSILAKIDRLTDETMRRFYGEFFTPLRFARKALDYIERTLGKEWWKTGEYRLWDMAAGTGNLEYHLPLDALPYTYLSTLYAEDVKHLERLFPGSQIFQYDYLNDDVSALFTPNELGIEIQWKLPQKLRNDLNNPKLKWILLINPPFATSQKAGTNHGDSKQGVSDTAIRKKMHNDNLGEVSRELFSQFIYRIKKEFEGKQTHLALFSTLKYINATNDQKLRDNVFNFGFEQGFVFSSANFSGTGKPFPIGMLIWDVNARKKIEEQNVVLDVFNENVEKIGTKTVTSEHRDYFLSKWIKRPDANKKYPPFGSAINVKGGNKDRRDRVADGFLASLMCCGNDIQHQNNTALLSGPYVSAGALSITPENFTQAMVVHAARRAPKATWLNDRDQFMRPEGELSEEFINDCTVWNLFTNSNNTASLKNVEYEGEIFQIPNHFFPYPVNELMQWDIQDRDMRMALDQASNSFMADWLALRTLSNEAQTVLDKGREIYRFYFANLNQLRTAKFKIESWDAGWWQIKQSLKDVNLAIKMLDELRAPHNVLKEKVIKGLVNYKIISSDIEIDNS